MNQKNENWIRYLGLGLFLLLIYDVSRAEENQKLTNYFTQTLSHIEESLKRQSDAGISDDLKLDNVNINVAPTISFGLSEVIQLTISPEVDFVLTPASEQVQN